MHFLLLTYCDEYGHLRTKSIRDQNHVLEFLLHVHLNPSGNSTRAHVIVIIVVYLPNVIQTLPPPIECGFQFHKCYVKRMPILEFKINLFITIGLSSKYFVFVSCIA